MCYIIKIPHLLFSSQYTQDPSTNLIPVAETWLQTDLCASNACTDEVTTTTGLQVHSACSADISKGSFVALVVEGALMVGVFLQEAFLVY